MNLCPSYIHLRATKAKDGTAIADDDNFYSEIYDLIDDEKIVCLKAIRVYTPYPVSIRLFVCQNWKSQPQNYCDCLSDPLAEKKICESNKTDYIFFYMEKSEQERSKNKPVDPVYMAAFARYSKEDKEIPQKIVIEAKRTAEWLGIAGSVIQCYVFYYTTNYLCNTFDWGAFKEKYNKQCRDPKYFFQFQYIPPSKKPICLSVNGGSPIFNIVVQEM